HQESERSERPRRPDRPAKRPPRARAAGAGRPGRAATGPAAAVAGRAAARRTGCGRHSRPAEHSTRPGRVGARPDPLARRPYFASAQSPPGADHFTLTFDSQVAVKSVVVTTGKPDGSDKLDAGALEASADGRAFEPLAKFTDGTARAEPNGRKLRAVRVKPSE